MFWMWDFTLDLRGALTQIKSALHTDSAALRYQGKLDCWQRCSFSLEHLP